MAQPAARATAPANTLAFPFNLRPLLAGWNALFHQAREFKPDPAKSEPWNRGAYLVESLGHCSACHSPRNALGAEQREAYLAGGFAEGWEAPPLTSLSHAPIPWSEDELFTYLRTGQSRYHGVAAGPMAPIVRDLTALPTTTSARWRSISTRSTTLRPMRRRKMRSPRSSKLQRKSLSQPPLARGSIRAPARFATRSAACRCSAAGLRLRSTAICTVRHRTISCRSSCTALPSLSPATSATCRRSRTA